MMLSYRHIYNASHHSGRRVVAKVVDSRLLDTAKRVGVYLYCPTLREVDTSDLVDRLLAPGTPCNICTA